MLHLCSKYTLFKVNLAHTQRSKATEIMTLRYIASVIRVVEGTTIYQYTNKKEGSTSLNGKLIGGKKVFNILAYVGLMG